MVLGECCCSKKGGSIDTVLDEIFVMCPVCGSRLTVCECVTYEEVSDDGEVCANIDIEYECKNGCLYDNNQTDSIDKEIERKVWGNT